MRNQCHGWTKKIHHCTVKFDAGEENRIYTKVCTGNRRIPFVFVCTKVNSVTRLDVV